jgi:hypothetical protein
MANKLPSYPTFSIVGLVSGTEHGETRPAITVRAQCYVNFKEEYHGRLIRDAKWRLECIGLPKDKLQALYFDDAEIGDIYAVDAKGVKLEWGERAEGFIDSVELKNRATLIRQRRLLPEDRRDMLEMYGPKVPATQPTDQVAA